MLRFAVAFLITALCGILTWATPSSTKAASLVAARAGILMDTRTGLILWEQNADARLPMASTTKIMTAMVILDHAKDRLNEPVTISDKAYGVGWSTIFDARETAKLGDVLKAILIASANQGAVAVAEQLAGSEEQFVTWMNEKAQALHLQNTHFVNSHGLHAQDHYSSARDLATMTRYAYAHYPMIRDIVSSGFPKPEGIQVTPRGNVVLWNKNKLLGSPVPGCKDSAFDGVKTGYVNASGACLVSSATQGGWQLIGVLLNSPALFEETRDLLHYGFSRYQWTTYANRDLGIGANVKYGAVRTIQVGTRGELGAPTLRSEFGIAPHDTLVFEGKCRAPIKQGERVGMLVLLRNGRRIATAPAIALHDSPVALWVRLFRTMGWMTVVLVALAITGKVYGTIAKNSRKRRRRAIASSR